MDIGTFRGNKYEVQLAQQGPNQVGVIFVEHGLVGVEPAPRELPQALFTPDEIALHHAYFSMLEQKVEQLLAAEEAELELDGTKVARAKVHAILNEAKAAKQQREEAINALALVEAEVIVKRAEVAELGANIETLRAAAGKEAAR